MTDQIKPCSWSDLPQHATDYTPDQRERVITFLAGLSLKELRQRQGITQKHICNTLVRLDWQSHPRVPSGALADLRAMQDHLTEAIYRQTFEPWRLTLADHKKCLKGQRIERGPPGYRYYSRTGQIEANHRREVEHALQLGRPVPDCVLKDYPDLVRVYRPIC